MHNICICISNAVNSSLQVQSYSRLTVEMCFHIVVCIYYVKIILMCVCVFTL